MDPWDSGECTVPQGSRELGPVLKTFEVSCAHIHASSTFFSISAPMCVLYAKTFQYLARTLCKQPFCVPSPRPQREDWN